MKGETRTPLEFAADEYRGAISTRAQREREFEWAQEAARTAQRRVEEAEKEVAAARRRLVEAAELPAAKEPT